MTMTQRIAGALFLALWLAGSGVAQNQEQADFISTVKAKNALTDEERNQLKGWIESRIQAVATGAGTAAARELTTAARNAAQGFRDVYAEQLETAIQPIVGRVERQAAAQLVAVLATLDDLRTLDTLVAALGDPRVAVRTAAAVGIRRLRPQIAQNPDALGRSLDALRDAGRKEPSPVALKTIYQALDQRQADPGRTAAALVDVLTARSEAYLAGGAEAWGADHAGLKLAYELRNQFSDGERRVRLIRATAGIMVASVVRYANEFADKATGANPSMAQVERRLRNDTELQIEAAEQIIRELVKVPGGTPPTVTDAMKGSGNFPKSDPTAMKIQMNEWAKTLQAETGEDFSTGRVEG